MPWVGILVHGIPELLIRGCAFERVEDERFTGSELRERIVSMRGSGGGLLRVMGGMGGGGERIVRWTG